VRLPALILAALLNFAATIAVAQPVDAPVSYVVQQGDTLSDLAARYLKQPSDYLEVQRLNQIADPRQLPVGMTLVVPYELLKVEPLSARLAAFRGDVAITQDGRDVAPALGLGLQEGARVTTGANAFATIQLSDGSRTTLPSHTVARVGRLRRVLINGALDRVFYVDSGRSQTKAAPLRKPLDRFNVITPLATAAVRGTEFRVVHDAAGERSVTEVLEGRVASTAGDDEIIAEAGFATAINASGVSGPIALLPGPRLANAGEPQAAAQLSFDVTPVAGAGSYRAQLATDAGFIDLFAEAESKAPRVQLLGVPDGDYFVRLTVVDGNGIEGLSSAYAFHRGGRTGVGPRYLFRWGDAAAGAAESFRFQLSGSETWTDLVVDEPGLTSTEFVVTNLAPGVYHWRVLATRVEAGQLIERWLPAQRFELGG
jgi:hypothetical protein